MLSGNSKKFKHTAFFYSTIYSRLNRVATKLKDRQTRHIYSRGEIHISKRVIFNIPSHRLPRG